MRKHSGVQATSSTAQCVSTSWLMCGQRTDAGDERHVGERRLREAAPGVPPRLVPKLVDQVVVVRVRQVAWEQDDVRACPPANSW